MSGLPGVSFSPGGYAGPGGGAPSLQGLLPYVEGLLSQGGGQTPPTVGVFYPGGPPPGSGGFNPISPGQFGRQPNTSNGPFNVSDPPAQAFGFQSPFNPLMAFDLMGLGLGPMRSPFAGSGLWGYPSAFQSPVRPGGGPAPIPQSGGKGMTA